MALDGIQHGITIKKRSIPENRLKEDLAAYDLSSTSDGRLINFATLKKVSDAHSAINMLYEVRVCVDSNTSLSSLAVSQDTISLVNGDKVLLVNQTNQKENGIYLFNNGNLSRVAELNANFCQKLYNISTSINGIRILVLEGGKYEQCLFYIHNSSVNFPIVDTHNLPILPMGKIEAGDGLKREGRKFKAVIDPTSDIGLSVSANGLKLEHSSLPGAGGVPADAVPHPDIDSVDNSVFHEGEQKTIIIHGGNFRRDSTVTIQGFTIDNYIRRKHNLIEVQVTAPATTTVRSPPLKITSSILNSGTSGDNKIQMLLSEFVQFIRLSSNVSSSGLGKFTSTANSTLQVNKLIGTGLFEVSLEVNMSLNTNVLEVLIGDKNPSVSKEGHIKLELKKDSWGVVQVDDYGGNVLHSGEAFPINNKNMKFTFTPTGTGYQCNTYVNGVSRRVINLQKLRFPIPINIICKGAFSVKNFKLTTLNSQAVI